MAEWRPFNASGDPETCLWCGRKLKYKTRQEWKVTDALPTGPAGYDSAGDHFPRQAASTEGGRMTFTNPETGETIDLVVLTAWMADNGYTAREVAYAIEKPWKYQEEYNRARDEQAIEGLREIEAEFRLRPPDLANPTETS